MRFWLIVSGVIGVFLAINLYLRFRVREIANSRRGKGFDDFATYFSALGIPRVKLFQVYLYFQDIQPVKNFPVFPTDDLYKVYGLADDDLDETVVDLAEQWGAVLPARLDGLGPVCSVEDLVLLLNRLPRKK